MQASSIIDALENLVKTVANQVEIIPGLSVIVKYVKNSYQDDPIRVIVELLVFAWAIHYLFSRDKKYDQESLTEKEIDELVNEWVPEPLVKKAPYCADDTDSTSIAIKKSVDQSVELDDGRTLLNWSSTNFLNLYNSEKLLEMGRKTVRDYGVGACGPAAFYGTMDVHMKLQTDLANLLKVDDALIYSQAFMAVASVIPAFSKRGDILVADDGVGLGIQIGLELSRSHVYFFKHNDMQDLERVLNVVDQDCKKKKSPLSRRFIVVEGLYGKSGDKCPLPEIIEIKKQYKYRLFVDESLSFGCLGPKALGISDYYGVEAKEIEFIIGSLGNSLGSSGGFCAGSHHVIDHQVLSSQAYIFSAALPPFLAACASESLRLIDSEWGKDEITKLSKNIQFFQKCIEEKPIPKKFSLVGDIDSPIRLLQLQFRSEDVNFEKKIMKNISQQIQSKGYMCNIVKYVEEREKNIPPPSIQISIVSGFTHLQIEEFVYNFRMILQKVL